MSGLLLQSKAVGRRKILFEEIMRIRRYVPIGREEGVT